MSVEGYDTLYVITRDAWDRTHPAGDTLNDLVEASRSFIGEPRSLVSFRPLVESYVKRDSVITYQALNLRINREPEFKAIPHALKLVYHLGNGEVYEAETGSVWFR